MAAHHEIISGFEIDGEAEVRRRVTANAYDGEHLAHALQWLHEVAASKSVSDTREAARRDSLKQIDGLIRTALAATALVAVAGLAVWAYQVLGFTV